MFQVMTEKVEAMCADGAADEQLAMAAWIYLKITSRLGNPGARVDIIWCRVNCFSTQAIFGMNLSQLFPQPNRSTRTQGNDGRQRS